MSGFQAVNAPGAYYAEQMARGDLDVFAVLGLHADLDRLSMRGARSHYRKVVMPHVFERNSAPASSGPRIPTWVHVNAAKAELLDHGKAHFERLKTAWSHRSQQTWNPFADPGSAEARLERTDRHVPPEYFAPDVEDVEDEAFTTARNAPQDFAGTGTQHNPFFFDSDDDDMGAASSPPPSSQPPPTFSQPSPSASPQTPHADRTQSQPFSAAPPTNSRQRLKPKGILLGTWTESGLHASASVNAVYGSRDIKNRINRRVAKVDIAGRTVLGGNYHVKKTACKHEHINYLSTFRGMSKQEVDAHIQPLLDAMEDSESEADQTARNQRDRSPATEASQRRKARAQAASSASGGESKAGGFQARGARFFVAQNEEVYEA